MLQKTQRAQFFYLLLYLLFVQLDLFREELGYVGFGLFVYTVLAGLGLVLFGSTLKRDGSFVVSRPKTFGLYMILGLVSILLLDTIFGYLGDMLLSFVGKLDYQLMNDQHLSALTASKIPAGLIPFVVILCGPLVEELIYRMILFGWLEDYLPVALAIALQGLVFGMIHMHAWTWPEFFSILPHMGTGLVLGYSYHKSGSLWVPIGLHILTNSLGAF